MLARLRRQSLTRARTRRLTRAARALTAIIVLAGSGGLIRAQDSPGYFGPIRFQRPVFRNFQVQPLRFQPIAFTAIPRQTIPAAPFTASPIVIPQIARAPIRRDTFVYSGTIFGPISGAPRDQAADQQERPEVREPFHSRVVRPITR